MERGRKRPKQRGENSLSKEEKKRKRSQFLNAKQIPAVLREAKKKASTIDFLFAEIQKNMTPTQI